MEEPPPISLAYPMFVIEYAVVDSFVKYHERKNLYVGGEWLGAVPKLAICLNSLTHEYHLSHCTDDWEDLCGVECRGTVDEIKTLAERRYEGITEKWINTDYTEAEAEEQFQQCKAEMTCSFCKKSAYDEGVTGMVVVDDAKICKECIMKFAAEFDSEST